MAIVCFAAWLGGCATNDASPTANGKTKSNQVSKAGNQSTNRELLTPESDEDLTTVTDAELETRMAAKRREIGRHMNEAANYLLDNLEGDLSSDRGYHEILRRAKQADTDLNLLEREVERRATARAKAG